MNRKGISFTLTLVVIGVVLLMTALTVVVLGGGQISDYITGIGEADLEAQISTQCGQLADRINNNYCSYYVYSGGDGEADEGDCDNIRRRAASNYEVPAENVPCNWQDDPADRLTGEVLVEDHDDFGTNRPIVVIGGDEYDCLEEGQMTTTCPA